jgi:hypothetical protein
MKMYILTNNVSKQMSFQNMPESKFTEVQI